MVVGDGVEVKSHASSICTISQSLVLETCAQITTRPRPRVNLRLPLTESKLTVQLGCTHEKKIWQRHECAKEIESWYAKCLSRCHSKLKLNYFNLWLIRGIFQGGAGDKVPYLFFCMSQLTQKVFIIQPINAKSLSSHNQFRNFTELFFFTTNLKTLTESAVKFTE